MGAEMLAGIVVGLLAVLNKLIDFVREQWEFNHPKKAV